jgi:hypothetical protein
MPNEVIYVDHSGEVVGPPNKRRNKPAKREVKPKPQKRRPEKRRRKQAK